MKEMDKKWPWLHGEHLEESILKWHEGMKKWVWRAKGSTDLPFILPPVVLCAIDLDTEEHKDSCFGSIAWYIQIAKTCTLYTVNTRLIIISY